jgi:hypothetical protein
MSQHDLTINNQGFPAFRADLNDALQALGSTQSGTTAPSPTFANQLWYDTTNNILKIRNEDNDAWISLLTLDQSADSVSSISTATAVLSAGTVSLPAITTTGDTNTGIFFPAADTIAFTEGGVESMRITDAGALQLNANLTFSGTGNRITGDFSNATIASRVGFQSSTTNGNTFLSSIPNGSGTLSGYFAYNSSDTANAAQFGLFVNGTTDAQIRAVLTGTGTYLPITMLTGGSERLRIDTSGNVGIGTSSPAQKLDIASKVQINTSNSYGRINIARATDSALALYIQGADNAGTANDLSLVNSGGGGAAINITGGDLRFYATSNTTERMRIDSSGNLLVGKTAASFGTAGFEYDTSVKQLNLTTSSNSSLRINRLTNDGTLVSFQQDSSEEGSISVSGSTVSYNGGHLSRWSQLPNGSKDETLLKGTVMSNLDDMCVWEKDGVVAENEQLNKMKVSDVEGDTNVAGVFVNWTIDEQYGVDDMNVAMTGDMIIRIADGVVVQKGDLLMSAGDGTAKPQGDDIVRSKTVAKVTSNHVTCTYADGSYCVPCVLMAC